MRKFIRKKLPDHHSIKANRWLRPLAGVLRHPNLWHLNRRSVAGGVATGLFCGLIPGPLQMLGAALVSVLFRVNLPVALFTTLYTNPLTLLPLYFLAYQLGAWVSGEPAMSAERFTLPELHWNDWLSVSLHWFTALGKPLLIGLPLLALILAVAGYIAIRVIWRVRVVWLWRQRVNR